MKPRPAPAKTEESNFDKSNEGVDVNKNEPPELNTEFTTTNPVFIDVNKEWEERNERDQPSYEFFINHPIPKKVTQGIVQVIFKDEYKIRYFGEERLFESLVGESTTEVNQLIRKVEDYFISASPNYAVLSLTEQQELEAKYAEKERGLENVINVDVPNQLSIHNIYVERKGDVLISFIEALRGMDVVATANYLDPNMATND